MFDFVIRNSGPIVFDYHFDTDPFRAANFEWTRTEQHAIPGPLERVFQQVAEQFEKITLLAVETRGGVDFEFAKDLPRRVYFFKTADDFLCARADRDRRSECRVSRRRRARQLIRDDFIHASDLLDDGPAQLFGIARQFQLTAQHRQRRFQAVREIGERIAITL